MKIILASNSPRRKELLGITKYDFTIKTKEVEEKLDKTLPVTKQIENIAYSKAKEVAKEHKIEIVENKPLARMLYHNVDIGQQIPPELYQAVAEVLAMVYHAQGKV